MVLTKGVVSGRVAGFRKVELDYHYIVAFYRPSSSGVPPCQFSVNGVVTVSLGWS